MAEVFILQNQHQQYLSKQNLWLDGRDPGALFKSLHKDEAINQMVEVNAKDYTQRIKIIAVEQSEKGLPIVPVIGPSIAPTISIDTASAEATQLAPAGQPSITSSEERQELSKAEQAFGQFLQESMGESQERDTP
ncbi:MAG: hypothetical protein ACI4NJ_11460 [Cellvibrio sp.]